MATKSLTVITRKHSSFKTPLDNAFNGTTVINTTEKWRLDIDCTDGGEDRELARFKLLMPNTRHFTASIQEIQNMEAIIRNARKELMGFAENGFTDKKDESEVLDTIKELGHLLDLFKN